MQDLNKQLEHLQVEQDAIIQERDCCQSRLQNYEIVLKKFPVIQLIEAEGESSKRFPTIISSVLILSSKQLVLNILNSAMNSWIGFNEIQSFCAEQQVGNTFEITMEHRRSLRFQTIDVPSGD